MTDRLRGLTGWRSDWRGLSVAVVGLDRTSFAVADTLAELGCDVVVVAETVPDDLGRLVPVIGARLETVPLDSAPEVIAGLAPDVVVPSPALPVAHPVVAWARAQGIAVWGDLEVAWRVRDKVTREDGTPADWLFVTGPGDMTSATHLTASMLVAGGLRAAPCGGELPVLDAVRDPAGFDVLVVAPHPAQLAYLAFAGEEPVPHSAACVGAVTETTDVTGVASVQAAQALVYRHARVACVYNKADERTMRMVEDADVTEGARAIGFDLGTPGLSDLGVVDGILADRAFAPDRRTAALELATIDQLAARGSADPRSVELVLASAALARACGASPAAVNQGLVDAPS